MTGTIVKGIAGFYYVDTGEQLYQCKARGLFRKQGKTPLAGDRVTIEVQPDGDAWITEIAPRVCEFARPPVANATCLVLVLAAAKPQPSPLICDRFLVMAEAKRIEALLVINKTDLIPPGEPIPLLDAYKAVYPVFPVCGKTGEGIEPLKVALRGKIAALAGPSGVGKSTLINCLCGAQKAETGEISQKLGRGKQTTRHAELFRLDSPGQPTYLFDTPGFTSFDSGQAAGINPETDDLEDSLTERGLQFCFPEWEPYMGSCKFDNCMHLKEPGCAVQAALKQGAFAESRYQSYCTILAELKERRTF